MRCNRRTVLRFTVLTTLLMRSRNLLATVLGIPSESRDPLHSFPAYLDTLVPADETPSATILGVDKQILAKAATLPEYTHLIQQGCRWLDTQAFQYKMRDFPALQERARIAVVEQAAAARPRSLPRVFFEATRSDAFFYYYGHPESWPGLGFQGPPQPHGYLDYTQSPANKE